MYQLTLDETVLSIYWTSAGDGALFIRRSCSNGVCVSYHPTHFASNYSYRLFMLGPGTFLSCAFSMPSNSAVTYLANASRLPLLRTTSTKCLANSQGPLRRLTI